MNEYIENNLFDLKLMDQYIEKYEDNLEITDTINEAVNKWISMLNSKELESELKHHKDFHHIILEEILGYPYDSYKCEENIGNNKRPDVILYDNKKPYVACELKSTTTRFNKKEGMNAIDQVTLYASKKEETKWAIVSNYEEIRLFNPAYNEKYISFKFEELTDTTILKKFLLVFSKFSLIDEKIPIKLLDETKIIQRQFEDNFYELFCETRLMLIEEIKHQNDSFSNDEIINYAQLILNRYLFICFAEALSIIPRVTKDTITTPIINENLSEDTIWQRLNELFKFIYKGNSKKQILSFEGDLFKDDLYNKFKICDFIKDPEVFFKGCYRKYKFNDKDVEIEKILSIYDDDETYDPINPIFRNLLLISSFDFSTELAVNILGHIFENSIGTLDDIFDETQDENEEEDGNVTQRQKNGIFYTPEYVTNYMCKNTIISYLSKTSEALSIADLIQEYQDDDELDILDEKLKNIKILDPACGSGAFLNKAVDILLDIHQSIHDSKNYSKSNLDKWIDSIETRKNILQNNIYGVDLSENSVELTKLSLFLKLASSKNVKEGFKLPDLNNNIKCGNSLITRLFDWDGEFKEIIEGGGFDVIIGNPPYLGSNHKDEYQKQREELNKSDEYETLYGKWDYYIAFIEKGLNY